MWEKHLKYAERHYDDMEHPWGVANRFEVDSYEWVVALFHDIIEDTEVTSVELGVHLDTYNRKHLLEDVVTLTRKDDETYSDYINRVDKRGGIAKKVKLADLGYNLSKEATLKPSLEKRYKKAIQTLGTH